MNRYSMEDLDTTVKIFAKNAVEFSQIYGVMLQKGYAHRSKKIGMFDMFVEGTIEFLEGKSVLWISDLKEWELFTIGLGMWIVDRYKLSYIKLEVRDDYELAVMNRSFEMVNEWLRGGITATIIWPEIKKEDYS